MNGLLAVLLTLVGAVGTLTVAIREPVRQTIAAGFLSLVLALLFFALQAPDVALSEIVVGSIAVPGMLLLAIAKIREQEQSADHEPGEADRGGDE
ncbi:MAG TPA: hydrogenase subunit MbhD domain-containing protein [Solirubrobacteraceae bacterium]|nr:hydrogenase subunit MbhD domain-containing protein [Solirubrobacteraceae bacterium]